MEFAQIQTNLNVLILAAGLGTRMRSNVAKVLHPVCGLPMITHVCRTASALMPEKIYIVIGYQGERVKQFVLEELDESQVEFLWQREQLGTAHAVSMAKEALAEKDCTVLILSGDVPLVRPTTMAALIQKHRSHRGKGASCTILSVKLEDPTGYGRIIRDETGLFERIVEHKDASDEEKKVKEINTGIYCFESRKLFEALSKVDNSNAQREFYLTDVPRILREEGEAVAVYQHNDPREVSGINNRMELAEAEQILRKRIVKKMMLDYGVTFIDPNTAYINEYVNIGQDTTIYPNVSIEGVTEIGEGCVIRSGTRISNSRIGRNVEILDNCLIVDSEIADDCIIGPMAHIRGKTKLERKVKIGNFVELKKTTIGEGSKASHLSYLGDATIGTNTNIGAGTITCNYDGRQKHPTIIGNDVKIGSDTMLVAPVKVGDGAVTGAGSVVIEDVPSDSLVVGVPAKVKKKLKKEELIEVKE
ncbi:MAG: bifunctional UDP-N-acetylglucosamine diphosphorylase/glucosamine-1-phosphate N-acetyltransferase GlmU [Pyrinomonadaceae bacterium]|nr:bifunctional UDP-N-acetylglucosamine diphosphorylase/glucosamine-1-phosphate N-acetyltransferase GlmU [Pyrinomonadaceae bacterium]MCX7640522.1 bifunctional UDP-N-acetylglucosamine diphosphorylase/glucosamine-1-phosphate N-acetyltransferase GlmU [Pyrinomonadaceae bacterium]MDW8303897.1 bifunctional UDP-N-acetylglucosamine diphosphorylase/glucosamine-1-phosphate N-acetyltransferase GlmU [Acidobacteriota bacterium]